MERDWQDGEALECPHGHAFTLRADGSVSWDDLCTECAPILAVDTVAA